MTVDEAIRQFEPLLPLAVGLSGGPDSVALLAACHRKWPGAVHAFHINHGLQPAATDFEAFCVRLCGHLCLPISVFKARIAKRPGQSPEEAARRARYQGILDLALARSSEHAITSVAIAHHANDQAETLLLALSRGSGVAGMACMPTTWTEGGLAYHRPFLEVRRDDILAWLERHRLPWIEDPTNQDTRLTRNRIRAKILPNMEEAFPSIVTALGRSARHAAQAQQILDDAAEQDLASIVTMHSEGLPIPGVQGLAAHRRMNALRYWLRTQYGVIPSTAQAQELERQILACKTRSHHINIKVGNGVVRRLGKYLAWYNP